MHGYTHVEAWIWLVSLLVGALVFSGVLTWRDGADLADMLVAGGASLVAILLTLVALTRWRGPR